ncbi:MAG TPA: hypothetical protein VFF59_11530, partial [Anaerolineae bacterium]|nr:hypothetical protein [Anaerolineae bacterium]
GALILFEYLGVPYPTLEPLSTSAFHAQIASDAEPYAILDIPLERSDTKYYLYYQTQHQHPLVQGRVARVPPEAYQLFNEIPLLGAWQQSLNAPRPPDVGAQLAQLADRNVRYVILHKHLTPPPLVTALRDYFTLPPVFEDDQFAVYSTRPADPPVTPLGDLGVIASWATVEGPDKPIRVQVRWAATGSIGRDYAFRLALIDERGTAVISHTDRLIPATSTWLPDALVVGDYQLTPVTPVPIGRYTLQLSVLDGDRAIDTLTLPQRIINVPSVTGPWIMVVSAEPRVRFNQSIELRAADVSRRGNLLSVWLHWYAPSAPGVDTKYFVHLLDVNGNVAVQDDGIHVKYTRPSSEWQADQMISDLIELPVWNVPPGEYRLAVGLTNPDTGERLPAVDPNGNPLPDNRYIFNEPIEIQ